MADIETAAPVDDMVTPDGPYYELLLMDDEHPRGHIGHVCNMCGADAPCAEHRPQEVPGLLLVDCVAEPRHHLWVLDGDYYPPSCWICETHRLHQREMGRRDAPHLRRRHGFRRTRLWRWLIRAAHRAGVVRGQWAQTCPSGGWCRGARWRWSR